MKLMKGHWIVLNTIHQACTVHNSRGEEKKKGRQIKKKQIQAENDRKETINKMSTKKMDIEKFEQDFSLQIYF